MPGTASWPSAARGRHPAEAIVPKTMVPRRAFFAVDLPRNAMEEMVKSELRAKFARPSAQAAPGARRWRAPA